MSNFIGITMGGLVDENLKLLSISEVHDRVHAIQKENKQLEMELNAAVTLITELRSVFPAVRNFIDVLHRKIGETKE